ncbi:thioredoxin domain-containing protein [Photobacterium damselae]|nr:thioredoxin domain-containing protein [Photobacterium damselae]
MKTKTFILCGVAFSIASSLAYINIYRTMVKQHQEIMNLLKEKSICEEHKAVNSPVVSPEPLTPINQGDVQEKGNTTLTSGIGLTQNDPVIRNKMLLKQISRSIFTESALPQYGDLLSDKTVILFSDYNCQFCRKINQELNLILSKENLRVIVLELPILSESSLDLALIAQSVYLIAPNKYNLFHDSLYDISHPNIEDAYELAAKLGINRAVLKSTFSDARNVLRGNHKIAKKIGINSTPALIINGQYLVKGLINKKQIQLILNGKKD